MQTDAESITLARKYAADAYCNTARDIITDLADRLERLTTPDREALVKLKALQDQVSAAKATMQAMTRTRLVGQCSREDLIRAETEYFLALCALNDISIVRQN